MRRSPLQLCVIPALLVASVACSDASNPAAQGTAQFSLQGAPIGAPDGVGCTVVSGRGAIGGGSYPPLPSSGPPPANAGVFVEDGQPITTDSEEVYDVSCVINGSGPYNIEASISGPNNMPPGTDTVRTDLDLRGTIQADGTGTGFASFFTQGTQKMSAVDGVDCTFRAVNICSSTTCLDPTQSPKDYGQAYIEFNCPRMTNGTLDSECSGYGAIRLDRCARQ